MIHRRQHRAGFTLQELVIAISASGALVAGMTSSIYIATQAVNPTTTPTKSVLQGAKALALLDLDLQNAVATTHQGASSIATRTPDRDGDDVTEAIFWWWSGTAGDPLYRSIQGASAAIVVDDVHDFKMTYHTSASGRTYVKTCIQVSSSSHARVESAFSLINL